jgi:branched-chain amino acid transport system substrate-binding protein
MKLRKSLISVLALAVVPMAFSSAVLAQAPAAKVKIGVMAPITGPAASIGTEQLNWAKLAVEDFNTANGWNVELVEGDTQLDPAVAVTVAESLIADADIYGVVGPAGSQEVEGTQPKFKDAGLVHISGSATRPSLTTTGFNTFFRTVPSDNAQGPVVASFIINVLKSKSAFLIDDQTSYSVSLADIAEQDLKDAGITVDRDSVTQKDTDFSALVTKIKTNGSEVVFFPGQIASQGALLGKQLQEQGVKTVLFGADGFFSVDDFIKGAGGATEGAYASAFAKDVHSVESSADIVKRYTDKYGDFGTFGPPTYAATMVLLEAIQRANEAGDLSRAKVLDEVGETEVETSVLGDPLSFDENGDVVGADEYIFQVKGDAFVQVSSSKELEAMTGGMEATPEATPSS